MVGATAQAGVPTLSAVNTVGSLIKGAATAKPDAVFSNPVESLKRI